MSGLFRPLQIASLQTETSDILCFELHARGGETLPPFEAGAHIEI
jgi:ferredoxin-NADP reductase